MLFHGFCGSGDWVLPASEALKRGVGPASAVSPEGSAGEGVPPKHTWLWVALRTWSRGFPWARAVWASPRWQWLRQSQQARESTGKTEAQPCDLITAASPLHGPRVRTKPQAVLTPRGSGPWRSCPAAAIGGRATSGRRGPAPLRLGVPAGWVAAASFPRGLGPRNLSALGHCFPRTSSQSWFCCEDLGRLQAQDTLVPGCSTLQAPPSFAYTPRKLFTAGAKAPRGSISPGGPQPNP